MRADKAIGSRLAQVRGTAEWFEAQAAASYNPAEQESWRAEVQKAREARGETTLHTASQLLKASGARSLPEAYLRETDPLAQQILHDVLSGRR